MCWVFSFFVYQRNYVGVVCVKWFGVRVCLLGYCGQYVYYCYGGDDQGQCGQVSQYQNYDCDGIQFMVLQVCVFGECLFVDYYCVVYQVVQCLFVFGEGGYQIVDYQGQGVDEGCKVVVYCMVVGQVLVIVVYYFDVYCYFVQCGVVG